MYIQHEFCKGIVIPRCITHAHRIAIVQPVDIGHDRGDYCERFPASGDSYSTGTRQHHTAHYTKFYTPSTVNDESSLHGNKIRCDGIFRPVYTGQIVSGHFEAANLFVAGVISLHAIVQSVKAHPTNPYLV